MGTKLVLTYTLWAFFLQHHAGAAQKVFAVFCGKIDRVLSLSGYLLFSLLIIAGGTLICRPYKRPLYSVVAFSFLAWALAFLLYWSFMTLAKSNLAYESPFGLLCYLVFPHILAPIPAIGALIFSMNLKAEPVAGGDAAR